MRKDYEVGRGKPPKLSQFKPGQSGNPKGRPKGASDMITAFENELDELVNVKINGVRKKIPMKKFIAKRVTKDAANGEYKAINLLAKLPGKKVMQEEFEVTSDVEEDLKELEDFLMNEKNSYE